MVEEEVITNVRHMTRTPTRTMTTYHHNPIEYPFDYPFVVKEKYIKTCSHINNPSTNVKYIFWGKRGVKKRHLATVFVQCEEQ